MEFTAFMSSNQSTVNLNILQACALNIINLLYSPGSYLITCVKIFLKRKAGKKLPK